LDQSNKGGPRLVESARKYLQRVLDEYPTTPSANKARELSSGLDRPSERHAQKAVE
jgi:hypothetical protein